MNIIIIGILLSEYYYYRNIIIIGILLLSEYYYYRNIINYDLDIKNIYKVESKSLVPALYNSTVGKKVKKVKKPKHKKGSKNKGSLKLSKKSTNAPYKSKKNNKTITHLKVNTG